MPVLHNRASNEMLKARMFAETEPRTTISFYKYFTINDPKRPAMNSIAFYRAERPGASIWRVKVSTPQISIPESKRKRSSAIFFTADPALNGLRLNIAPDDDGVNHSAQRRMKA